MTFDEAFTLLLGHEGKYSNNPKDPGGETMWGVTVAVARANGYTGPMKAMPVDVAKAIYRKRYWNPCHCDDLPEAVRYLVFDAAVNSGVSQSAKWLQHAVGVEADGIIGYVTLTRAKNVDVGYIYRKLLGQRLRFMASLTTWDEFGEGWANRIAALLEM